jgi:hypothetical protein
MIEEPWKRSGDDADRDDECSGSSKRGDAVIVYVAGVFRGRPGRAHLDPECLSIRSRDVVIVDSADPFAATLEPCHLCGGRLDRPLVGWSTVMDGAPRGWLSI